MNASRLSTIVVFAGAAIAAQPQPARSATASSACVRKSLIDGDSLHTLNLRISFFTADIALVPRRRFVYNDGGREILPF
jgi:hypothetical protein